MTTIENDCLKQYAVLYPATGSDSRGNPSFGSTQEIKVRYDRRRINNFSSTSSPTGIVSSLRVSLDIAIGSKIWFGRLADLPDTFAAGTQFEVLDYEETPDLKARYFTRRVTLKRIN